MATAGSMHLPVAVHRYNYLPHINRRFSANIFIAKPTFVDSVEFELQVSRPRCQEALSILVIITRR